MTMNEMMFSHIFAILVAIALLVSAQIASKGATKAVRDISFAVFLTTLAIALIYIVAVLVFIAIVYWR